MLIGCLDPRKVMNHPDLISNVLKVNSNISDYFKNILRILDKVVILIFKNRNVNTNIIIICLYDFFLLIDNSEYKDIGYGASVSCWLGLGNVEKVKVKNVCKQNLQYYNSTPKMVSISSTHYRICGKH